MPYFKCCLIFLLSLSVSCLGYGALRMPGKEEGTLRINIRQDGLTRLAIDGDRIQDVIGLTGLYELKNHAVTGDVFIKPVDAIQKTPFSFFVTSEKGRTYEVIATPVVKAEQTIIIVPQEKKEVLKTSPLMERNYEATLIGVISEVARGDVPAGFVERSSSRQKRVQFSSHLIGRLLKRYQRRDLDVSVYRLTNTGRTTQHLKVRSLSMPQTLALSFLTPTLKPHSTTTLYRVSRHERT